MFKIERKHVKMGAGVVVSIGTGIIVSRAIKANVPLDDLNKIKKVAVGASTIAIGWAVGNAATRATDETIDEVWDVVETLAEGMKSDG